MHKSVQPPRLILASKSPRRRELLTEAGYQFEVHAPSELAEQGLHGGETPEQLVTRLARQKAADVAAQVAEGLILACDTVAECDGRTLGKPAGRPDARQMLEMLRGREHRVFSGVCIWEQPQGSFEVCVDVTTLRMDRLTDQQIDDYLTSGGWQGKAGAFGYQDRLGWVHVLQGSESNVVGLPLELLYQMLKQHQQGK